jgi:hypothetical protein
MGSFDDNCTLVHPDSRRKISKPGQPGGGIA